MDEFTGDDSGNRGVNGILFYTQKDRRHLIRNKLFYPSGENLVSSAENTYQALDNQQVDPRFVEAESFDFHLKVDFSQPKMQTVKEKKGNIISGHLRKSSKVLLQQRQI